MTPMAKAVSGLGVTIIAGMLIGLASLGVFSSGIAGFSDFLSQGDEQSFNKVVDTVAQKCSGETGTVTGSTTMVEFENLAGMEVRREEGRSIITADIQGEEVSHAVENCEVDFEKPGPINQGRWSFEATCDSGCGSDEVSQVTLTASEVG